MSITTTEYTTSIPDQKELDCLEALKKNITTFKKGKFFILKFYINIDKLTRGVS